MHYREYDIHLASDARGILWPRRHLPAAKWATQRRLMFEKEREREVSRGDRCFRRGTLYVVRCTLYVVRCWTVRLPRRPDDSTAKPPSEPTSSSRPSRPRDTRSHTRPSLSPTVANGPPDFADLPTAVWNDQRSLEPRSSQASVIRERNEIVQRFRVCFKLLRICKFNTLTANYEISRRLFTCPGRLLRVISSLHYLPYLYSYEENIALY